MACDVVSVVIWSLPSHKELKIQSPRVAVVDKCVEDVLEACSKEQNKDRFCTFLYGTSDIAEVNIRHPQACSVISLKGEIVGFFWEDIS